RTLVKPTGPTSRPFSSGVSVVRTPRSKAGSPGAVFRTCRGGRAFFFRGAGRARLRGHSRVGGASYGPRGRTLARRARFLVPADAGGSSSDREPGRVKGRIRSRRRAGGPTAEPRGAGGAEGGGHVADDP